MVDIGSLAQRVLRNAANKLGGVEQLAAYLGVSVHALEDWMAGNGMPPTELILRVVDLLIDEPKRNDSDRREKANGSSNG